LAVGLLDQTISLQDRLIGMTAGFAGLWLLATLYKAVRGRDGLGGGDPKLLGAVGAWLGWQVLPHVLIIASVVGLLIVAFRLLRGAKVSPTDRLPFGTLIAVAAFPLWVGQQWVASL
jgi:leader peptidase (prepilin peptidase) / N-methyltransferase